jgi:glycosyltransferase involved in cell wall biosynthesis
VNEKEGLNAKLSKKKFHKVILLANGLEASGGPYESMIKYLSKFSEVPFLAVRHPLLRNQRSFSEVVQRDNSGVISSKFKWRPNFPPITYLLDGFFDPKSKSPILWMAFNNLSALRAILRSNRDEDAVILWSIDFVPMKSSNYLVQKFYKHIDKYVHLRVSQHWEVSQAALDARIEESGKVVQGLHKVVPMGIWKEAFSGSSDERFQARKVAYFGSVDERNGADMMAEIIVNSHKNDLNISFEIIGGGSKLESLKAKVSEAGASSSATFYGFIENEFEAYQILGNSTIAIAPFIQDNQSWTAYADPSKFKAYLAASLPILTSDVPPNALDLQLRAGASVIDSNSSSLRYLEMILEMMENQNDWTQKSEKAQIFASQFDWQKIISEHFGHFIA